LRKEKKKGRRVRLVQTLETKKGEAFLKPVSRRKRKKKGRVTESLSKDKKGKR